MRINILGVICIGSILLVSGCTTIENSHVERITPEQLAKIMPQPVANLSLDEIVRLSQQSVNADEIINKINATNSHYELTPTQTLALSKKGVDAKVLDYMHTSNEAAKQNAVADEINKREKAKAEAQQQLRRQQESEHQIYNGFYDPFWPGYGFYPYGFLPYGYAPYGFRNSPYWRRGYRIRR